MNLEKFTFGVGDRFAHQALSQLRAFEKIGKDGVEVIPVWNKSNREHSFIGSEPSSVLSAAREAITQANWTKGWHIDADHIRLETVDRFIDSSDFFTIDVADSIGQIASPSEIDTFLAKHPELIGTLKIPGLSSSIAITRDEVISVARKYLKATMEAGAIYRHVANKKGEDSMFAEVSMDETDVAQTPRDLLIILAALSDQKIRLQTIAPKFTGRFNKGVDYVGDLVQFEQEFRDDLAVLRFAVEQYQFPTGLKLSVHSGSDKFSLYPIIRRCIAEFDAGLHIKTAGTTWLEELIGLCEAGSDGLQLTREIYAYSLDHIDELCGPYASVIDIDRSKLPSVAEVQGWGGPHFASVLRHIPTNPFFNANVRQLLHVAFKVAAKAGKRYTDLLKSNSDIVGKQVFDNLYLRHMRPLFIGQD